MAVEFAVTFEEQENSFNAEFKETVSITGGYDIGYNDGYEAGKTEGFNNGYADGKIEGYNEGHTAGTEEGYSKGHAEGTEQGYNTGYADGEESRFAIEDELIAKTLVEYHNSRPVTIGNRLFSYCYNLVTIDLPNCVSVGDYAFTYCTALKEIELPRTVDIAAFAFQNCTALTTVKLGAAKALPSNVFTNTNINKLILRRTDTITTNNSTAVFNNTPMSRGEGFIYVPDELVEQYKTATNWSTYASQIKPLSELEE